MTTLTEEQRLKKLAYDKEYALKNSEKIKERSRERYLKNKESILTRIKDYHKNNAEKVALKKKEYWDINKTEINKKRNEYFTEYRKTRKPTKTPLKDKKTKIPKDLTDYRKAYYQVNKEKLSQYAKDYSDKRNERNKERKATEPLFKLKTNIRSLIRETINSKGYKKATKSVSILGCTFEQFKLHLESKFEDWMTWDNYGNPKDGIFELNKTWDIDHIVPINKALTEEDVVRLNHYTNLQPLCSYTNRFIKRDN